MRRWTWVLMGWIFMGALLLPVLPDLWGAPSGQVEKDINRKKKDLNQIKKELSLTKEKEKEIRGKESSIIENLSAIETDLYKKGKELKEMERQLGQIKDQRQETKSQVVMLNQGMERTRGELFSRLTALYKMGRISPEMLLLTSRSYLDLLRIDKCLRVIIDSDARILETHRYQVVLKERYEGELSRNQSQWQRSISGVEKKGEEIKKVREEKRALLKSIRNQKVVTQRVIGELENRAKELQGFIEKLEKEKAALAYNKAKGEPVKGKLVPPVQGKVISLFKDRGQNGVEIKAPAGAEIRAVLPGRVLYADWFKGFGNVVIIDHGDHIFTVSGYSSQLLKKEGDTVTQGEPIALVGSAGSLKGPCLYFEIRRNGKPEDPIQWIPQLDKIVSLPGAKEEAKEKGKKEM
jgi:septal ring factor EnvC (AmiA/AmiB activator)